MKKIDKQARIQINENINKYITDINLTNYQESEDQKEGYIQLDLRNVNIYNEYSGETLLDRGIFHFIEETYKFIKKTTIIKLNISFPEQMTIEEQTKIYNLIKVHYAVAYKLSKQKILKTKILAWILLGIGALLFLFYGLLEWYNVNFVFRGIIEIFSWVFIWESCNLFVFTNTENKMNMVKYLRLFSSISKK